MVTTPEQKREFRKRRRKLGKPAKSGKSGKKLSLFECGEFVAIDGEGFSEGPTHTYCVGERDYQAQEHFYAYLASSDGSELYNPTGRLGAKQCLDFLIDAQARTPHSILVTFGASYDMCQMLMHGIQRDDLDQLMHGDGSLFSRKYVDITLGQHDYRLECRMRKQLSVWRWPHGADKYQRTKQGWKLSQHDKAILWDVWGFFQGTYVAALERWLPNDPDTPLIVAMKAKRSTFERHEIGLIREYTGKECRTLVDVMNALRVAIRNIGLTVSRWDGAGAIASAMFRAHDVKQHMADSPPDVFDASRHAYSGGHIEMFKLGFHKRTVHHYDISSAYPHWFRTLPSLEGGNWTPGTGKPIAGFTLVKVQFRFTPGLPFYPLFYREKSGAILYPERGAGWYWYPEFEAAQTFAEKFGAIEFQIIEWWHFQPHANVRPFQWIETYFDRRAWLINEAARLGIPRPGEEYTLRLGYNACYGKTAQQVGARWDKGTLKPPAYFQLEWSGYVTAGCRAQVMHAAMQKPDSIIAIATDGLFSVEPLDLDCPPQKTLGTWEYSRHDGMTAVMPGVYWLHDKGKTTHHSRGFSLSDMADASVVHRAWQRKQTTLDVQVTRLITLGTALTSDVMWSMRGMFVDTSKMLALNGDNSKRWPVTLSREQPHRWLVETRPRDLREDYALGLDHLGSAVYPIDWIDHADDEPIDDTPADDDDLNFSDDALAAFLA